MAEVLPFTTPARVLVLYNEPTLPADHPDYESEREVVDTARIVADILGEAGYWVARLGVSRDPMPLVRYLREHRPDVVFNLFEGTAEQGHTEAYVLGLLEWLEIPFTGCPSLAAVLARDKPRAKMLLKGANLPTPAFDLVKELPVLPSPLGWPVIVKPAYEDASVGLDQGSVVTDQNQLDRRVDLLLKRFGPPVLVEEYVAGREFNLSVVEAPELQVLPIAEIMFDQTPGLWPILTYDAKWYPSSSEYQASLPRCPADVDPELAERLRRLAQDAFRLFSCRDYARVDFRVNEHAEPFILEVNPNPDFNPTAGLTGALLAAGLTHAQFTLTLVRKALQRRPAASVSKIQQVAND